MNLTWDQMKKIEPGLADLEKEIREIKVDKNYSEFHTWFGEDGYKRKMIRLVGFRRKIDDELANNLAYDVAYRELYKLVPPENSED